MGVSFTLRRVAMAGMSDPDRSVLGAPMEETFRWDFKISMNEWQLVTPLACMKMRYGWSNNSDDALLGDSPARAEAPQ